MSDIRDLVVALAKKFCEANTQNAALDAKLVYEHVDALEREDKLRAIEHVWTSAKYFITEIKRIAGAREFRGAVEKIVPAFMSGFSEGVEDVRARMLAARIAYQVAPKLKPGEINAEMLGELVTAVEGYCELLETIAKEIRETPAAREPLFSMSPVRQVGPIVVEPPSAFQFCKGDVVRVFQASARSLNERPEMTITEIRPNGPLRCEWVTGLDNSPHGAQVWDDFSPDEVEFVRSSL